MTGTSLEQLREELLARPAVREAYEKQAPEYAIARAIIAARAHAGLSQAELAARMATSQPFVARLEGGRTLPSMRTPAEGRRGHGHRAGIPPEAEARGGIGPALGHWSAALRLGVRAFRRSCEASMIPDVPYRFTIRPLSEDGGGGYPIEFPDLPGCMSDGETIEEAIVHGIDAMRGWIEAMGAEGPQAHPLREAEGGSVHSAAAGCLALGLAMTWSWTVSTPSTRLEASRTSIAIRRSSAS